MSSSAIITNYLFYGEDILLDFVFDELHMYIHSDY